MSENAKIKVLALIAKKIKEARQATGLSQESFASEAGIARTYYSRIEIGQFNFSIYKLIEIAEALDIRNLNELVPMDEIVKILAKDKSVHKK